MCACVRGKELARKREVGGGGGGRERERERDCVLA